MLHIWIFVGVIGLAIAESSLTITTIRRILNDDGDAKQLEIEYSGSKMTGSKKDVHLTIEYTNVTDQQISLMALNPGDTPLKFDLDLKDLGGKDVQLLLSTTDEIGTAALKLPAFLDAVAGAWVGLDEANKYSLRVAQKSTIGNFQLDGLDCKYKDLAAAIDPCFYVGTANKVTGSILEFCETISGITVCDATQTVDTDHVEGGDLPDTSVELKYPKTGDPQLIIAPKEDFEYVFYQTNDDGTPKPNSVVVCQDSPCTIAPYKHSSEELQILFVNLDTGAPKKSIIKTFTDYEIVGTALSSVLLEARWTKAVGTSYSKFYVTRDEPAKAGFTETSVTCTDTDGLSDGETMHCFAYFTGLTPNKDYAVSVNPSNDGTNDINNNKVTLTLTHTPETTLSEEQSLELSSLNVLWQNNLKHADISICFKHHDMTELSRFQAIFINKHGQSKRFNGAVMKSQDEACVSTTNFDVGSFHLNDLVTIVMVKRGQDGLSVLASDQTDVHFDELSGALAAENILQIKNHRTQEIFTKMMLSH